MKRASINSTIFVELKNRLALLRYLTSLFGYARLHRMRSAVSIFDNLFILNPVRKTLMISLSLEDQFSACQIWLPFPGNTYTYVVVSNSIGCIFLGKLIFLNYQQFTNFTFCFNFLVEAGLEPAVQGRDMNLSWLLLELSASFSDRSVQGSTPIASII